MASFTASRKQSFWEELSGFEDRYGGAIHTILDVVGMVPVVGEFADAANAVYYAAEGDYANAALSAAGAIPGLGQAVVGAKLAAGAVGVPEPSSEVEIQSCEAQIGVKLPGTYRDFLLVSNGALLYESDELFGVTPVIAGIGNLSDFRGYAIAEMLPASLVLFHDNGFECHAFDTSTVNSIGEYPVVQWDSQAKQIVKQYLSLSAWIDEYLKHKWEDE
jgi:hypothetical protein